MAPVVRKIKKLKTSVSSEEKEMVVSGQLQKKLEKKFNKKEKPNRGVVLLRHLPHGFFEDQLKSYFNQFGTVTRVRLARSRKTGGPKGFAYVEFDLPDVAKIAAGAMDNYLMFQKIVKAHYIPPEEQKYNYFKTKVRQTTNSLGKKVYVSNKTRSNRLKVKQINQWNNNTYGNRMQTGLSKLESLKKKHADLGIDFDSITVKPNLALPKNEENSGDENNESNNKDCESKEVGSLLLVKKRKATKEDDKNRLNKKSKTGKSKDKNSTLEKLINDTIVDTSSEDDDYIPDRDFNFNDKISIPTEKTKKKSILTELVQKLEENTSDNSSEDESYVANYEEDHEDSHNISSNSSDEDEQSLEEDESEEEHDLETVNNVQNDSTPITSKPIKSQKSNHLEERIHRKINFGGIQKKNKNSLKDKMSIQAKSETKIGKMKALAAKQTTEKEKSKPVKKSQLKKKK